MTAIDRVRDALETYGSTVRGSGSQLSAQCPAHLEAAQWAAEQRKHWPAVPARTPESDHRRDWAQVIIAKAEGPIPFYGSREWGELADDDPRKAASAIRAAEAWAQEGEDLPFLLAQEDYERRRADDVHWDQVHAQRRRMVSDQLERMRVDEHREKARVRPVKGYQGGPVDFFTGEPLTTREEKEETGRVRDGGSAHAA